METEERSFLDSLSFRFCVSENFREREITERMCFAVVLLKTAYVTKEMDRDSGTYFSLLVQKKKIYL